MGNLGECLGAFPLGLALGVFQLDAEEVMQFAGLVHLGHDIAAADELALDVELGEGGPLAELLEALADFFVFKDIEALELGASVVEDLHGAGGEAAHRAIRGAFHEEHDGGLVDQLLEAGFEGGVEVAHDATPWG